jgi:hypothetical protein
MQNWENFPNFTFPVFNKKKQRSKTMRISDDRYSRDRQRYDLALRFIQHEARTRTIRTWTGLTDDRIRKILCSGFTPAIGILKLWPQPIRMSVSARPSSASEHRSLASWS